MYLGGLSLRVLFYFVGRVLTQVWQRLRASANASTRLCLIATVQSGIGDALAAAEEDGEGGGTTAANDDNGGNDGSSSSGVDDGPATATVGGVWAWLVDGSGGARRTMLLGVAAMYLLSGVVFALAAAAPQAWPGCGSAGQRPRRRRRAAAGT